MIYRKRRGAEERVARGEREKRSGAAEGEVVARVAGQEGGRGVAAKERVGKEGHCFYQPACDCRALIYSR